MRRIVWLVLVLLFGAVPLAVAQTTLTMRTDQKVTLTAFGLTAEGQKTVLPDEVLPAGGRAEALRPGEVVYVPGGTPLFQPKYPPHPPYRLYDWSIVDARDPALTALCGSWPVPNQCNPVTGRYEPARIATGVKGLLVLEVSADGKSCTVIPNGADAFPDLHGTHYANGIGDFEIHVRYGNPDKGFTDATVFGVIKLKLVLPTAAVAASTPVPK